MQAVILCGGKGTRLSPLTRSIPKSMALVNGRPFLEYLLLYLKSNGILNILLLTGYLGDQIETFFRDGGELGLQIIYCREERQLGTGGALLNAEIYLEDRFLLLNGDTYFPLSYQEFNRLQNSVKGIGSIVLNEIREPLYQPNIALGKDKRVIKYDKYDSSDMTHVDGGLAMFDKSVLKWIPDFLPCSLEEDVYPKLIDMNLLFGFSSIQRFYDIGTEKRLETFEAYIRTAI